MTVPKASVPALASIHCVLIATVAPIALAVVEFRTCERLGPSSFRHLPNAQTLNLSDFAYAAVTLLPDPYYDYLHFEAHLAHKSRLPLRLVHVSGPELPGTWRTPGGHLLDRGRTPDGHQKLTWLPTPPQSSTHSFQNGIRRQGVSATSEFLHNHPDLFFNTSDRLTTTILRGGLLQLQDALASKVGATMCSSANSNVGLIFRFLELVVNRLTLAKYFQTGPRHDSSGCSWLGKMTADDEMFEMLRKGLKRKGDHHSLLKRRIRIDVVPATDVSAFSFAFSIEVTQDPTTGGPLCVLAKRVLLGAGKIVPFERPTGSNEEWERILRNFPVQVCLQNSFLTTSDPSSGSSRRSVSAPPTGASAPACNSQSSTDVPHRDSEALQEAQDIKQDQVGPVEQDDLELVSNELMVQDASGGNSYVSACASGSSPENNAERQPRRPCHYYAKKKGCTNPTCNFAHSDDAKPPNHWRKNKKKPQ